LAIRFLVFSYIERFRKNVKRHSKELGEKRPNPVPFCFTALGENKIERPVLASAPESKNGAQEASPYSVGLCAFALPIYSIPVEIQEQCITSKQAGACKQHALALGLCG
jgi:hypothetical protein